MKTRDWTRPLAATVGALALLALAGPPREAGAFERKRPAPLDSRAKLYSPFHKVPGGAELSTFGDSLVNGADWRNFLATHGPQRVHIDPETGRIVAVAGRIPWIPGSGNSMTISDIAWAMSGPKAEAGLPELEKIALKFVAENAELFRIPAAASLRLNPAASAKSSVSMWNLRFDLFRGATPVENGAVVFVVKHGNLILWGSTGVDDLELPVAPTISPDRAAKIVGEYVGGFLPTLDTVDPKIASKILPERSPGFHGYREVYEVRFKRKGQGNYVGRVDVHSGNLLELFDSNDYAQVKGGIYPITNDAGTEVVRPLGFADYGTGLYANSGGTFPWVSGTVTSTLNGKYVAISDTCGAISLSTSTTPGDLDFGSSTGTDCVTPGTGGVGNTHAARSCYYHTDLIAQKGRAYLPSNSWLQAQLTANVNLDNTCNAYWDGAAINFFKSGGGCGNTGEIAGVFLHEWGHGMDENDGNGAQGSGEAMGDAFAFLQLRDSCIGQNFTSTPCDGYGNPCSGCTGVRDQDRLKHDTPEILTPANINARCGSLGGGSDPCGEEVHCEGYLPGNTVWDLAYRDLPARPMAVDDAWALADKLWWESGPARTAAYSCTNQTAPPWNNGCGATTWFETFLAADDADGNLANGTPHAATIFQAFDRHGISCGTATDPANLDSSECPAVGSVGTITGTSGSDSATVTWSQATNAASYRILRNTLGCSFGSTEIAFVADNGNPTQSFTDTNASNGTPFYYTVQPVGTNVDCPGPTSNCVTVTPQPCAGTVTLDRASYSCADLVSIRVVDSDLVGAGTTTVTAWSITEAAPETRTLTETPASSGVFIGSVATTSAAPAADGAVSVMGGDTLTVRYVDASYCGTPNTNVDTTGAIDCSNPVITNVLVPAKTDSSATITWDTNEPASSRVNYGLVAPPTSNQTDPAFVSTHSVTVQGLAGCSDYLFSVSSLDPASNGATDDNAGAYYTFRTTGRAFALGPDTVESGPGSWTADSTGTTIWHIDDCSASSPTHAWKAGAVQGDCPGSYDTDSVSNLTSATFSLGAAGHGYSLRFDEYYDTEENTNCTYDPIVPQISVNSGSTWTNLVSPYCGSNGSWQKREIDLAPYSGDTVKLRFRFTSDSTVTAEGWYVDNIDISKSQPCGTELAVANHSESDACSLGGSGSSDGFVDPGETVTLTVVAANPGTSAATGISATLSSSSPSVTILDGLATFPDIPAGGSAPSNSPHFTFRVDGSVVCGTVLPLNVLFTSAQGSWSGSISIRVGAGGQATTTYVSTNVPRAIPDNNTTGVTSTVDVADTGTVVDVNVSLSITHTWDADVEVELIGPNNTVVLLTADHGSSGDNYTNTVFDDQATSPVSTGTAPFTGSFQPDQPLSVLNGINANGTWTLRVRDDASSDIGTLQAWSLILTRTTPYTCTLCACASIASPVPATAALATPVDGATGVPLSTTLTWGAAANAGRYKVNIGTSATPPFYREVKAPGTSLAVRLAASTTYYWQVVTFPTSGSAPEVFSPVFSFTTAAASETVTGATPAVLQRWNTTPSPFVVSGSGFGSAAGTSLTWQHIAGNDAPGFFTPASTTATALTGTIAMDPDAKAGWYDLVVNEGGSPVAAALAGVVVRAFSDVTEADWYFESSDRMTGMSIMPFWNGASGPEFRPTLYVTRGDMAEFLVKAYWWANSPTHEVPGRVCFGYFPDVPCADPQALYVEWARDLGITLGGADGGFHPANNVTRAEMAAFLLRLEYGGASNVPDCQPDPGWADLADIPDWAKPYVNLLRARRITFGCSASPLQYCPLTPVSRSEMATFLSRLVDQIPLPIRVD
jgi:subtilisin-like proprotein convertase family protein